MIYAIEYEHLKDDLVTDEKSKWHFDKVKKIANDSKLELSDDDFKRLYKLHRADVDISWIAHRMSVYKMQLADALVLYITC